MQKLKAKSVEVGKLEGQVRMLSEIADFDSHPFIFSCLEANLSSEQVNEVLNLMERAEDSLSTTNPMNHVQFEHELYQIVPTQNGNYQFAKTIVMTLHDEHRFNDVYERFRADGMNI